MHKKEIEGAGNTVKSRYSEKPVICSAKYFAQPES